MTFAEPYLDADMARRIAAADTSGDDTLRACRLIREAGEAVQRRLARQQHIQEWQEAA